MNSSILLSYLQQLDLNIEEVKPDIYKGFSCNVKNWHSFRIWVNKKRNVTIKTKGIQKSFNISNLNELKKELKSFELI